MKEFKLSTPVFWGIGAFFPIFFVSTFLPAMERNNDTKPEDLFAAHLASDSTLLESNPQIAKAHETWKTKIEEVSSAYLQKLEMQLEREKTDLDFIKGLEKTIEAAKNRHCSPCILYDRLPSKLSAFQTDMNKGKSRANRNFVNILDKEIASAVKRNKIGQAKTIEKFLLESFLPKSMEWKIPEMTRFENKILLFVPEKNDWQDAYDWCRERNGDLASVRNKREQLELHKIALKTGKARSVWTGGVKAGDRWCWSDGTSFSFTSWAKGEPSGVQQERISFGANEYGNWDGVQSSAKLPFIIQWTLF